MICETNTFTAWREARQLLEAFGIVLAIANRCHEST
jgi:hypothetical protein